MAGIDYLYVCTSFVGGSINKHVFIAYEYWELIEGINFKLSSNGNSVFWVSYGFLMSLPIINQKTSFKINGKLSKTLNNSGRGWRVESVDKSVYGSMK